MRYDLEHSFHELFKSSQSDWELPEGLPSSTIPKLKPSIMAKSIKTFQADPLLEEHGALQSEKKMMIKDAAESEKDKKVHPNEIVGKYLWENEQAWRLLYNEVCPLSLHAAANNNHPELITKYLDEGAFIDIRDHNRRTALHIAAMKNFVKCIQVLIDRKADIDAKDENEQTPLELAFERRHYEDSAR